MRIISDFHDYYDAVQATGQDQTLIYFRKPEEVQPPAYPLPVIDWSFCLGRSKKLDVHQHIVGFCGKIYPVVVLTQTILQKSAICHALDEVDFFFETTFRKKEVLEYRAKTKRRWAYRWQSYFCREAFEKYFVECAEKKAAFLEMFFEKQCPVWVGTLLEYTWRNRKGKIVYNASLKELEFYRLFDTYTAFQEIAMFLGGLAVPLKEIPEVPDKIMVGIKGFDEWSFRKPPRDK